VKLLLTGFEPFGDWTDNPSWDALVLARDSGLLDGLDVAIARLPVSYRRGWPALRDAVLAAAPRALVCFGLHGGLARDAATLYVETTARNRDGASKADNDGVGRPEAAIVEHAPATLAATLDVHQIVDVLRGGGYKAELSDDAGKYLCNHVFFRALHELGPEIGCGFIHVPPVRTDVKADVGMGLEGLARAVALVARNTAGAA
jgi:pyroglutamyl-peptidase